MALRWGKEQRVPPGLWAKVGFDERGDPHILMSPNKETIKNSNSTGHDHYWKRGGRWYVQIRLTPNAVIPPVDEKGHLWEKDRLFEECPSANLDSILRQLVES